MARDGRHTGGVRSERARWIVLVVVVGLLALGVGWALGARGGGEAASPSVSPASSVTPSPSDDPTPSASSSPTQQPSPTVQPAPETLGEGRHFVMARKVTGSGDDLAVVVDLAYFLTDADANEAAAEHGMETPVPDGYFIVNDNPKLRTVPLSPDATVTYIPVSACCDEQEGDLSAWIDSVNGAVQSDYPDMSFTWWWVTVRGDSIVAIEQQFLP